MAETPSSAGRSPLRHPSRRVAELAARVIVAADRKLGVETDPRVLALARLPKAS
jgi:hypothetical protein